MRKRFIGSALAGAIALSMLPGIASAQAQAFTNSPVNVYAGPAQDYPVVAQLPDGTSVGVNGCVEGYTWCDVEVPGMRGWVYGGSLSYPYEGGEVPIMGYGPSLGLPIVVFSIGSYWGDYYRDRPWYHDEGRWRNHPPPPQGPPPGYRPPGPVPGRGVPPQMHGGPPPQEYHGGQQQEYRGAPPQGQQYHGGPPPGQQQQYHGGPQPQQNHGAPPPQQQFHGGPAPQAQPHGGPQPEHGGGGGGGGHEPVRQENGGNH